MNGNIDAVELRLRAAIEASHEQVELAERDAFPRTELAHLQDWQRQRLARTYADLHAQDRYRPAVTFFLEELYGGLNFQERDRQVEQVLPIMVRLLPGHMLDSMAGAFRLQALSLALDRRLAEAMQRAGIHALTDALYCRFYTEVPRSARQEQLDLIGWLGHDLARLVSRRGVLLLIRSMRNPALAAGFGALQGFLERGLGAFRTMRGSAGEFVDTVLARETAFMERLYAGHESSSAG